MGWNRTPPGIKFAKNLLELYSTVTNNAKRNKNYTFEAFPKTLSQRELVFDGEDSGYDTIGEGVR